MSARIETRILEVAVRTDGGSRSKPCSCSWPLDWLAGFSSTRKCIRKSAVRCKPVSIQGSLIRICESKWDLHNLSRARDCDSTTLLFDCNPNPANPAAQQPVVEIYEAFIHAPVSITELVSCELQPQAVEIQRARLHVRRLGSGQWNIVEVINALKAMKSCAPRQVVPVSLADCQVEIEDISLGGLPVQLTEVALDIVPIEHEGRLLLQLAGQFEGREFASTNYSAYVDLTQQTWTTAFNTEQIKVSKTLFSLLPADFQNSIGEISEVAGYVNLSGSASGDLALATEPIFQLHGKLADFSCSDPATPAADSRGQPGFRRRQPANSNHQCDR